MKNCIPFILFPLFLFCCKNEDDDHINIVRTAECLDATDVVESDDICEPGISFSGCDIIPVGTKYLSEKVKEDFVDYCLPLDSEIEFYNEFDEINIGRIQSKEFERGKSNIRHNYGMNDCTIYCLNNEKASIEISTDRFSLEMSLYTGINFGIDSVNYMSNITSQYNIWGIRENRRQVIFQVNVEDYFDRPTVIDTTSIRYHRNITLNGKRYSNVLSNENNDSPWIAFKEKVYFHLQYGLIAVQDSTGVLWTRYD